MNTDRRLYGNGLNPQAVRDIEVIHESMKTETDPEEITRLNMLEMMASMEMATSPFHRSWRSYFPY